MYSDKTCSGYNDAINPSKKIIAIVVNSCVDNYQCFAMAITPVQVAWSTQPFDIPSIQQNSDNGKENLQGFFYRDGLFGHNKTSFLYF